MFCHIQKEFHLSIATFCSFVHKEEIIQVIHKFLPCLLRDHPSQCIQEFRIDLTAHCASKRETLVKEKPGFSRLWILSFEHQKFPVLRVYGQLSNGSSVWATVEMLLPNPILPLLLLSQKFWPTLLLHRNHGISLISISAGCLHWQTSHHEEMRDQIWAWISQADQLWGPCPVATEDKIQKGETQMVQQPSVQRPPFVSFPKQHPDKSLQTVHSLCLHTHPVDLDSGFRIPPWVPTTSMTSVLHHTHSTTFQISQHLWEWKYCSHQGCTSFVLFLQLDCTGVLQLRTVAGSMTLLPTHGTHMLVITCVTVFAFLLEIPSPAELAPGLFALCFGFRVFDCEPGTRRFWDCAGATVSSAIQTLVSSLSVDETPMPQWVFSLDSPEPLVICIDPLPIVSACHGFNVVPVLKQFTHHSGMIHLKDTLKHPESLTPMTICGHFLWQFWYQGCTQWCHSG